MTPPVPLPPGWADLRFWPGAELGDPLKGGSVNDIRAVHLEGRTIVARRSSRRPDDLDWEAELLSFLARSGMAVPRLIPDRDGLMHRGGLVLMEFVEGSPPETDEDRRKVADYLHRLHDLTSDWTRQRPGWCSLAGLTTADASGPVDLTQIPSDVVETCRRAWSRLQDWPCSVIHGDPNPTNIRINGGEIVLLDWDESRVDVPQLDLSALPEDVSNLGSTDRDAAEQAVHAWETCLFWNAAPDYARRRYSKLA